MELQVKSLIRFPQILATLKSDFLISFAPPPYKSKLDILAIVSYRHHKLNEVSSLEVMKLNALLIQCLLSNVYV